MSIPTYETLEQAQEAILDLHAQIVGLENERDTLSQNNEKLTKELDDVRTLNQKYFNQLCAQFQQEDKNDDEEEEVPSCADFARTHNIL